MFKETLRGVMAGKYRWGAMLVACGAIALVLALVRLGLPSSAVRMGTLTVSVLAPEGQGMSGSEVNVWPGGAGPDDLPWCWEHTDSEVEAIIPVPGGDYKVLLPVVLNAYTPPWWAGVPLCPGEIGPAGDWRDEGNDVPYYGGCDYLACPPEVHVPLYCRGHVLHVNDYDYYYFEITTTQRVEVKLSRTPEGDDYDLVIVYPQCGGNVIHMGWNRGNVDEVASFEAEPSMYVIMINAWSCPPREYHGAYELTVSVEEP